MGGLDEEVHAKVAQQRLDFSGKSPIILSILKFGDSLPNHNTVLRFLELSDVYEVLLKFNCLIFLRSRCLPMK